MKKISMLALLCLAFTQVTTVTYSQTIVPKRWLNSSNKTQSTNDSATFTDKNHPLTPLQKDLWGYMKKDFKFKIPENSRIKSEKQKYLAHKNSLSKTLENAEPYIYQIVQELKNRKMPVELALLPLLESAFNPKAHSSANAQGLWQIIASTADLYNNTSNRTNWFEPRKDFIESTRIALNILQSLNQQFNGDWLLTLAAYNAGDGRIRKAIKENKSKKLPTHFWALDLPKETTAYIPRMLALIDIIKNNQKYNFALPKFDYQNSLVKIKVNKQVELKTVSRLSGINFDDIVEYNAGYIKKVTVPSGPHYVMVPEKHAKKVHSLLVKNNYSPDKLAEQRSLFGQVYTAQTGTPDYDVSAMNEKYGKVSDHDVVKYAQKHEQGKGKRLSTSKSVRYKVRKGDTISTIAKKQNVKTKDILAWNKKKNAKIKIGETLILIK